MKPAETLAGIQNISCLGLPSEAAIPAMLQLFDRLVDACNSNFVWVDRAGRPTNIYARFLVPAALDVMLHHSHLTAAPGEIAFEMHSNSRTIMGNMARFKAETNYEKTVAYNEIWKPHCVEQFADLVVHDERGPRGLVMIGRQAHDPSFSSIDRRRIGALRPWLLHALDTPPTEQTGSLEVGEEAVVLCDSSGRVVQLGDNAAQLLLYAGNGRIAPGAVIAGLGDAIPEAIRKVCVDLAKILSGQLAEPPCAEIRNAWGAYKFRAHPLQRGFQEGGGTGLIVVVIRRHLPWSLALQNRVAKLPLTPRQRQVAVMIGLGKSPEAVQAAVNLTPGTYRRHLEEIHGRLGVHSRAALLSMLHMPQS